MTNISLPQEDDFKRWIREVIREELHQSPLPSGKPLPEEILLSRQQIAAELGISLVTLTDWMKKVYRISGSTAGFISNGPR
jgi:hypothetical protein